MTLLNIYSTDMNLNTTNCTYDNIISYIIYYIHVHVLDYVCKCITSRGLGY